MNIEIKKLTRQIYLIIAIIAIALAILFWFFTRSFSTIKVTPANAVVTIDNGSVPVTAAGIAKRNVVPGIHSVKVEADGFIGISQDLNFSRGFMKTINIALKEMPQPVQVSGDASFLAKGSDFNDGYYLGSAGTTLYKMKVGYDSNGAVSVTENTAITDAKLSGIREIIWSPKKDLALFRKSSGITLFDFMKYDFVHQTENAWGNNIGNIAWAPDNSKIAYSYAPPSGEKSLIFANLTDTVITRVYDFKQLGIENPVLQWSPDSEWLLIIPQNSDASGNKIYLFNAYSLAIKSLTDSGSQVDAAFSPDGNQILYSTYSKDPASPVNTVLSVMNADGSNQRSLDIRADINKVAWAKDSRYIIVATMDTGTKQESIFKYDTEQKEKAGFVINNLGDLYITSLTLSDDGKIVLYQTKDGIYALKVE